ncbi:S1C family serine protease [Aquibacillus kalidii]|uniref:S1C family serine protease n=1 Tax=Aquibacillus kalidii TaxID=2762597 RepID=UPI001648989A|nr:serine protease [Aquibacillus kalidii]
MNKSDEFHRDVIDEDLYEEFDDEELFELIEMERQKALAKSKEEKKPKRPFPKWAFWLIAIAMFINVIAILPKTFSIPALEFLVTSARLVADPAIDEYQESIVVIETETGKGTGFSISSDGYIITNYHVIDDTRDALAAFPEEGLFDAKIVETYPEVDLALLKVEGEKLPFLPLATETTFSEKEHINFIGNPLKFNGIANEGNVLGYTQLKDWDQEVLMLDAPVYRGNSGSPVINSDGEVIAVIFATLNHEKHGRIGLAVPIDYYHDRAKD